MKTAVTACFPAGDGGPAVPTDEAVLERAQQPPSAAAPGPPEHPHSAGQGAGCGCCWVTSADLLVDEAPVLDPLWSCWKQDFSPRAGWKGWDFFLEVWAKLPQTSPGINLPVLVRSSPVVLPGWLYVEYPQGEIPWVRLPLHLAEKACWQKTVKEKNKEPMRSMCQGLPGRKLEGALGELTRQNSWAQSPPASSLCPQTSGSAAARWHSMQAGGERANAMGVSAAAGPGKRPWGVTPRALLRPCLAGWWAGLEAMGTKRSPCRHRGPSPGPTC